MENNRMIDSRKAIQIEVLSNGWMLIEFLVALWAGVTAKSLLLVAFGLDSILEVVSGSVLIWRLKKEFNGSSMDQIEAAETKATKIVSWILVLLSAYITINSVYNLINHEAADNSISGILIAVASLVIMPFFVVKKKQLGAKLKSDALTEDGLCNVTCAYMAGTVLVGIICTQLFGWWWADSVAALGLVYLIMKEALEGIRGED